MVASFSKTNNLLGWAVFAIAAFTYISTAAPTTSFWDAGEYISTAVKLQVGHPPGAPLFQLMGNVFSSMAGGDVTEEARWVNYLSALSSAFTILFLFWTITLLGRKFIAHYGEMNSGRQVVLFGAAVVGSLTYTWSDSFWFSAVEGEVYAMSSLFTAMAFWGILKWEREIDRSYHAHRWLILIAFFIGLSIGVHILVFLTIPAIVMVYFYKTDPEISRGKFILYNIIGVVILGTIFALIIPLVLNMFGKLEIFMVNSLGMPFNSGTIFTVLLLAGAALWGLLYTRKKSNTIWNTLILSVIYILLGYSTFITLAIRSNANTPIDENNPEDAMSLLAYYNREQYGDFPVFYGRSFNAPLDQDEPFKDGTPVYRKDAEKGKYVVVNDRKASVRNFDDRYLGLFPRMWNDNPRSVKNYKKYAPIDDPEEPISLGENIAWFLDYQVGHMWWRYFMWNFAGRQNDEQHKLEYTKGNWISGIDFLDEMRLGPQDNLPYHERNHPARNTFYLLPFLLGVIGAYFHFKKAPKDAWVVALLFLFTGLAIAVYLNHKPFEPRERDYAYVGSFYAFVIWAGMGVIGIFEALKSKVRTPLTAGLVSLACLVAVPVNMVSQTWNDHDRSERYTARDIAKAYLDSCAPNAILFTNGDNDTFPLWYIQEIEGYRTDVRVVNLSLLNTAWYIDQQKRQVYDGKPVPFTFEHDQYKQGTRDVIYYQKRGNVGRWKATDFIKWTKSESDRVRFSAYGGKKDLIFFPTKKLRVNIDKEEVLQNNVVEPQDSSKIVDYIDWKINTQTISKRDLMVIDLIAHNDWERPIYFSVTVGNSSKSYFWLDDYFRLEGLAYRYVPIRHPRQKKNPDFGRVDTEIMYSNLIDDFHFENMGKKDVYLDETNRRVTYNLRNIYGRLAKKLADQGKNQKALKVLDRAKSYMPEEKYAYDYFVMNIIEGYYKASAPEKAEEMISTFSKRLDEELQYYAQFTGKERQMVQNEIQAASSYYGMIVRLQGQYDDNSGGAQQAELFENYRQAMQPFGGGRR